jgi:hypothetical protein
MTMISANPTDEITVNKEAIQGLTEESHIKNKPSLCQGVTTIEFLPN